MKKFINSVDNVEKEMLEGLFKAHPDKIKPIDCDGIIVRREKKTGKVAIITGGGSGHEPSFGGYVGKGMLDAAVAGAIYTSPSADHIYEAIKHVATDKGVLMIPMNYTGDIMNFEMAAEMAQMDDITTDMVVTNDDVAVDNSLYTVGRRGVAGTVLVHKIAGAMAETGASLEEVKAAAQKAIDNVRTMGVAINPSTIPSAGKPGFVLAENEMEVGIGIYGEPGVYRDTLKPANDIADVLLNKILADIDYSGSEVALIVNGSGGTPLMELYLINNHVHDVLASKGIEIYKTFVGNYMTSIEQEGFSLTLMKLDDQLKSLLDAPADTIAFKA
ncbi:MAG: dihydroxyacetone kinase subunit DhaK [Firmicutes bacterium]|nr:dihydroxyacetone kinase subunit DhaK [Candidatus Colimorpha enterica]